MKFRNLIGVVGAACLAVTGLFASGMPASAEASMAGVPLRSQGVIEGKVLDLRQGWGEAQSCIVHADKRAECYETAAEADAALGYDPALDTFSTAGDMDCANGWICLWQFSNGDGRRLIFNDEYWHTLADWGFARTTSSWRNNQGGGPFNNCTGNDDPGALGDGAGGVLSLGDCTMARNMGVWDNRAVHVHG